MVDKCQFTKTKNEIRGLSDVTTRTYTVKENKPSKEALSYREMQRTGKMIF